MILLLLLFLFSFASFAGGEDPFSSLTPHKHSQLLSSPAPPFYNAIARSNANLPLPVIQRRSYVDEPNSNMQMNPAPLYCCCIYCYVMAWVIFGGILTGIIIPFVTDPADGSGSFS